MAQDNFGYKVLEALGYWNKLAHLAIWVGFILIGFVIGALMF